jgi:hypothetical protein
MDNTGNSIGFLGSEEEEAEIMENLPPSTREYTEGLKQVNPEAYNELMNECLRILRQAKEIE